MSGTDLVQQFADLFEGRKDAWGTEAGGCLRAPLYEGVPNQNAVLGRWQAHLNGDAPIGVYPLVRFTELSGPVGPGWSIDHQWYCKWGCVDLDVRTDKKPSGDYTSEDECHTAAVNLQKTLKHFNVTSWIERTRSNARHLWVFASTWVPASVMRRALLVATSVAGVSSREVNPKQETLSEGQVGSYVRLPYPGGLKNLGNFDAERYILADEIAFHDAMALPFFVERALAQRTPIVTLEHIASLYRAPAKPEMRVLDWLGEGAGCGERLNALGKHLFLKPVDQISDRSMHIEAFVRASKDSGLTASETLTLADDLAARCGKFDGRRDREDQLRRIVERAYS